MVSDSGADTQSVEAVHTQALCSSRERSAQLSDTERHLSGQKREQKDTYQVKRERNVGCRWPERHKNAL